MGAWYSNPYWANWAVHTSSVLARMRLAKVASSCSSWEKATCSVDGLEDVAQVSAHQECQQAYNEDTAKSKSGFGTAGKAPAVIYVRTFPSSV